MRRVPVRGVRIGVTVPDVRAGLRLYEETLEGVAGDHAAGAATDSTVRLTYPPGVVIDLSAAVGPGADGSAAGLRVITLEVTDPAAARAALLEAGAVVRPATDRLTWMVAHPAVGSVLRLEAARERTVRPLAGRPAAHVVEKLDHVCIAVRDLAGALDLLTGALAGTVVFGGVNRRLGTVSSQVTFPGGGKIELLQSLTPELPVGRYVQRRGPGLHHVTFLVPDVEAAGAAVAGAGFEVVGTDLSTHHHWRETYVRPGSAFGALIQLAWTDRSYAAALDEGTVEAIVRRRIDSEGYVMKPAAPVG